MALKGQIWRSGEPVYPTSFPDGGLVVAAPVASDAAEVIGAVLAFVSLRPLKAQFLREGQEAAGAEGGFLAYVVDRRGHLLFSSDPAAFPSPDLSQHRPRPRVHGAARPADEELRPRARGRRRGASSERWRRSRPRPTGASSSRPRSRAPSPRSRGRRRSRRSSPLLAVALAGVVALVAARFLSRPVLDLVEKVRSVADGHFKQRVPVRGVYELAQLSETFNSMSDSIEKSVERLRLAARENQELFINSIRTLAAAIDAKDPYTRGHSERVARYSVMIARHMELSPEEVRTVRLARASPRRRQDRDRRPDPPEADGADERGVRGDEDATR